MIENMRHAVLLVAALAIAAPAESTTASQGLRDLLRVLATEHEFEVDGLELVSNQPPRTAGGDLRQRLKRLLHGYNYLVIDDDQGNIRRLIFLPRGEEGDLPAVALSSADPIRSHGEHVVPTLRRGMHQAVKGVLAGPNLVPVSLMMIVDTGASTIVLPDSMIQALGFQADALRDVRAQTANGVVEGRAGVLDSVGVGSAAVKDVAVIFVEDSRLNGNLLLGMSFLRHFQVTIDDDNNRIILTGD